MLHKLQDARLERPSLLDGARHLLEEAFLAHPGDPYQQCPYLVQRPADDLVSVTAFDPFSSPGLVFWMRTAQTLYSGILEVGS